MRLTYLNLILHRALYATGVFGDLTTDLRPARIADSSNNKGSMMQINDTKKPTLVKTAPEASGAVRPRVRTADSSASRVGSRF